MVERGVDTVVMEVSSHALALGRVDGTRFAVGLIGTIGIRVGGADLPSALTTPEAPTLQAMLAACARISVSAAIACSRSTRHPGRTWTDNRRRRIRPATSQ